MNNHHETQNPDTRNSLPNGTPSPAPPTISNEYDILSHALHHNGYWPERSLIILTAEVPTAPNDTVLFAGIIVPLRVNCTPTPCAGENDAVLVKIELPASAVVPER